jgi:hypothetical protein
MPSLLSFHLSAFHIAVFVVPHRSVVAGSICGRFQRSKPRLVWCPERWDAGDSISFCPSLLQSTSPCPCLAASQRRRRQHLQALSTVQVSSKSRPLSCCDTRFFWFRVHLYSERACVRLRFLNVVVVLHGCFRVVCCPVVDIVYISISGFRLDFWGCVLVFLKLWRSSRSSSSRIFLPLLETELHLVCPSVPLCVLSMPALQQSFRVIIVRCVCASFCAGKGLCFPLQKRVLSEC